MTGKRAITEPEHIIYIFIDGIGFGKNERSVNPFSRFSSRFFGPLGGLTDSASVAGDLYELDPTLGLPGVPQSATGQTALFTGFNAVDITGRHCAGFPPVVLRPYIKKYSILKRFITTGQRATLINTYTTGYLAKISQPRSERLMSASTLMQLGSGQPFLTEQDHYANRSIFMDITNWQLKKILPDVREADPFERGQQLVKIARNYKLICFEYFLTDRVGHDGNWNEARLILSHLDEFLSGIWSELDPRRELVVITSDHGNFEDLSIESHTTSPVPVWVHGCGGEIFNNGTEQLYDVPRKLYQLCHVPFVDELPQL